MQKLSKAAIGRSYTIQWMFGVPEVMDFLREHHVEAVHRAGSSVGHNYFMHTPCCV